MHILRETNTSLKCYGYFKLIRGLILNLYNLVYTYIMLSQEDIVIAWSYFLNFYDSHCVNLYKLAICNSELI